LEAFHLHGLHFYSRTSFSIVFIFAFVWVSPFDDAYARNCFAQGSGELNGGELTDETVVAALLDTEKALVRLLQRVKAANAEEAALMGKAAPKTAVAKGEGKYGDSDSDDEEEALLRLSQAALSGDVNDAVLAARPHNQRIELPTPEDGLFGEGDGKGQGGSGEYGDNYGGDDGDDEGGELTRDKVKKHATAVVRQKAKEEEVRKKAAADALLGIY
jgi:hypothetical protein